MTSGTGREAPDSLGPIRAAGGRHRNRPTGTLRPVARTSSTATPAPAAPVGLARVQRVLAGMAVAVIALGAVCVVVLLVCLALKVPPSVFAAGGLRLAAVVPFIALPIGLLLALAAIAVNVVVRSRAAR